MNVKTCDKSRGHIRILAAQLDRGAGSHVYHHELARRLAEREYEVSVIGFQSDCTPLEGVGVTSISFPNFASTPLLWRYASTFKYWYCGHAMKAMRHSAPDLVIGGEHLWLRHHVRKFPGIPWIYLPHSLTVRDEILGSGFSGRQLDATLRLYRKLQSWALSHADCTVRFTKSGCASLQSEYSGLNLAPFVLNEVGIDVPSTVMRSKCDGALQFLILGRLAFGKGIDIALDSLGKIKTLPWLLTIVGDGGERDALMGQAERLGIAERVRFVGHTMNPGQWYSQADLLLFPSRTESLGLVPLEAMAHGVPCLAFRPDGRKFRTVSDEFITHEISGLLAGSPDEFVQLLRNVIKEPNKILQLGERARNEVLQRFSWERHILRYESLFKWLMRSLPRESFNFEEHL